MYLKGGLLLKIIFFYIHLYNVLHSHKSSYKLMPLLNIETT